MLRRLEVKNFKGFKDRLIFDLSAREYNFNKDLVKDDLVNKALVYGKNGTGKSNLGIALFDLTLHLTDKQRIPDKYLQNYINLNSSNNVAEFDYFFNFDGDDVEYRYEKSSPDYLLKEELIFNGKQFLYFDYFNRDKNIFNSKAIEDLNFDLLADNKLSVIKFIYKNTPTNTVPLLSKLMEFCEGMLWYRTLSEGNMYFGFTNGVSELAEIIYRNGDIKKFETFLRNNDLNYNLEFRSENDKPVIYAKFSNGQAKFDDIASAGTASLYLFYAWSLSFDKVSLLFIDEFDAFLHFESAANITRLLNEQTNFQSILTSHNTYLMKNELTRPDCCYIMSNNQIKNLIDSTDKEIREAHNLEKMYVNGAFNE